MWNIRDILMVAVFIAVSGLSVVNPLHLFFYLYFHVYCGKTAKIILLSERRCGSTPYTSSSSSAAEITFLRWNELRERECGCVVGAALFLPFA